MGSKVETPRARPLQAFLVHSGVLEGSMAVGMMASTYVLLGLSPSAPLLVLAFCGTLVVYQIDRVPGRSPEDTVNRPSRVAWRRRHRRGVWVLGGGAAVVALGALPFLSGRTLLVGMVLGAAGLSYNLPILSGGRRLKSIGPLKSVAVAAGWAVGGVVAPALETHTSLGAGIGALAAYRFLFVAPNAFWADAADRPGDLRAGLCTIATEWSDFRLRAVAVGALVLAIAGGGVSLLLGAPRLLAVDLVGPILMLELLRRRPAAPVGRLGADLILLWPAVTAAVAWGIGF